MGQLKTKTYVLVVLLVAALGTLLIAQQKKASKKKITTHQGDDVTITINNCVPNYQSVEATKSVTFTVDPNDNHTYYIFFENPAVFNHGSNYQKIDKNNPSPQLKGHSGTNKVTTLWWADPTTACSRAPGTILAAGDPNDITIP